MSLIGRKKGQGFSTGPANTDSICLFDMVIGNLNILSKMALNFSIK
jgi:hypothetical protein